MFFARFSTTKRIKFENYTLQVATKVLDFFQTLIQEKKQQEKTFEKPFLSKT